MPDETGLPDYNMKKLTLNELQEAIGKRDLERERFRERERLRERERERERVTEREREVKIKIPSNAGLPN